MLKKSGIIWKNRRLVSNFYLGERKELKIGNEYSEFSTLAKGNRQGCSLSPTILNAYFEEIINECLDGREVIDVGGRIIECIKFADDMILLAEKNLIFME